MSEFTIIECLLYALPFACALIWCAIEWGAMRDSKRNDRWRR